MIDKTIIEAQNAGHDADLQADYDALGARLARRVCSTMPSSS